eukprot:TRINITY_DN14012_c0_g1_i1.p1 TRINITY_DN14012_c0_g1~~TRINITY_DN14012_c0_g1_i1.p1  ORF type:complete len:276 (+),score=37.44 TRINITY_DN14012_c0_g1_i1:68-895(+)
MRFKAKIQDIQLFQKFVQTVEKIDKSCIIHLSPKKIQFILMKDSTNDFQVWAGMNAVSLFSDYKVESLNKNEISFRLQLDNLLRALKSGQYAQEVLIKLTKKDSGPHLCLVITRTAQQSMNVVQDIPVEILSSTQFANYTEPKLPDPEVYIMMPPLKGLRNVIDKMKNISNYLTVSANMGGELTLKLETDSVSVATFYIGLEHPQIDGRSPPKYDKDQSATVKVEIKKFSQFLYSHLISPSNVICCLVEKIAMVLHVLVEDLFITYYIPVLIADE